MWKWINEFVATMTGLAVSGVILDVEHMLNKPWGWLLGAIIWVGLRWSWKMLGMDPCGLVWRLESLSPKLLNSNALSRTSSVLDKRSLGLARDWRGRTAATLRARCDDSEARRGDSAPSEPLEARPWSWKRSKTIAERSCDMTAGKKSNSSSPVMND